MTTERDFPRVENCVKASALYRAVDAVAIACEHTADRSATAAWVRDARARFASLGAAARLRAAALLVLTASVGHILLLYLVPARIAPAIPTTLWLLVAAAAFTVMLCAQRLAAEWDTSFVRRLVSAGAAPGFQPRETRP